MSVIVEGDRIRLAGRCLAGDAETLLVALSEHPEAVVDLEGVQKLHLAVVQILLAARRRTSGTPENRFIAEHVLRLVQ